MSSTLFKLNKHKLIHPPPFLLSNTHYECIMGSVAYGVSSDTSDIDIYGWCIPPKNIIFPHLAGEIMGFGKQKKRFEQYEETNVVYHEQRHDLNIYNIVKYFQLCLDGNPNLLDSLFVPRECVSHITQIGEMVREQRCNFLHKGCWHRFKGYSYSQLSKIKKTHNDPDIINIRKFEEDHNIPHTSTFTDLCKEMEKRNPPSV